MHPEICKIGPFTIYSYGLMLALAFITSFGLAKMQAKRHQIDPDTLFNFLFFAFVSGVIGARIFYITENLDYYIKNPLEIIMLPMVGLSWFGGLILGVFAGIAYLKHKKIAVYKLLDLVSPFLALAQAIGRIGCLLNGCCFGRESKFGLYFPVHKLVLIPVQLYSSLALIFIFIILRFLQDKPHRGGEIFFAYLLLYSVKRFFIEFLRADNPIILFGLTLFQIVSVVIFCSSLVKLILIKRSEG